MMFSISSLSVNFISFVSVSMWTYITVSCTSMYARRVMEYDDKKVVQSVLQTFTNVTQIDCAGACLREKYCLGFHVYSGGPTCLTLREIPDSNTVSTDSIGYRLFQTDKPLPVVGSDCELEVDCKSVINASCHNGSCRCDVGHLLHGSTCQTYAVACASYPGYTWDVESGLCYMVDTSEERNWTSAQRSCRSAQGDLIRPDTLVKLNLLQQVMTHRFWIGLQLTESEWRWTDSTVLGTFLWSLNEPSGDGTCAEIAPSAGPYYRDASCLDNKYYVCEIILG